MNELYPLKFKPLFKEKIWGGQKIRTKLGMDFSPLPNCGEAWLLSGLEGNVSVVSEGFLSDNEINELGEVYMGDLLGEEIFEKYGSEFPLLFKILDTVEYLSLQVHPDDELARKRHRANGKTEMWYILSAGVSAEIITGFKKKTDAAEFLNLLRSGREKEALNIEAVRAGDVFYTPPGRVHALGPGIMLAEIQQSSDITYRIHDWGRVDKEGNSRELHTELAMDAIDYRVYDSYRVNYQSKQNGTVSLVRSTYFHTSLISLDKALRKDYNDIDSFIILFCAEGSFELVYHHGSTVVNYGELVLIPNLIRDVGLYPKPLARILEVHMH